MTDEYNRAVQSTQYQGIAVIDGTGDSLNLRSGIGETADTQVRIAQEMGSAAGDGTVGVYMGTGAGSLRNPVHYAITGYSSGIMNADVNGDGAQDIAVSGSGLRVFTGNGDGTLNSAVTYAGAGFSLAVGDLNNDAVHDFAISQYATGSSAVLTFMGNADSTGRRKNIVDTLDLSSIPGSRSALD